MGSDHAQVLQATEPFDFAPFLDVFLVAKRLAVALTVWMFYDLLLASPELYTSFLSPSWSLGRILYFLNRLVSPVMMLIHTLSMTISHPAPWVCAITPWTFILGNWLVILCLSVALIARIHALWQNRWVLIGATVTFSTIYTGNFIYAAYTTSRSVGMPSPFPEPFTGCFQAFSGVNYFWVGFLTTGVWETVCVTLTVWKAWKAEGKRESPILYLIFYDGILYYISVVVLKAVTIITGYYTQTSAFGQSNAILAFSSMLCTQLYLRLRGVANKSPTWICNTPPVLAKTQSRNSATSDSSQRSTEEERYFWAHEKPLPPVPIHFNRV